MSARHQSSLGVVVTKNAIKKVNNIFANIQKINSQQLPIPPPQLPVAGGGVNLGSGTQFPILYPIAELGDQTNSVILNLANKTLHFQKLIIHTAGTTNVSFTGLVQDRAVTFILDIKIDISGVTAINWPVNLFGVPTLPLTNGSRFFLEISGSKDSSEERYYVVSSSFGTGSSSLWSGITIDTNKDMGGFDLTNLSSVGFAGSAPTQTVNEFILGNYMHYDFADTVNTNIGFEFSIKGSGYFQIIHNTSATPYTDFLFAQVPLNMNDFIIYNIDDLRFNTTGNAQRIDTSGDGNTFLFYINGISAMQLSPETTQHGGVLEVLADPSNSSSYASMKIVADNTSILSNRYIGELDFDAWVSSSQQETYAKISGIALNQNIGSISGSLVFDVWTDVGPTFVSIFSISGRTSDVIGMNLHSNPIYNIASIETPIVFTGSNTSQLELMSGVNTAGSGADIVLYSKSNVFYQGRVVFTTPNAAGTADIERMWISGMGASGSAGIDMFEFLKMNLNQIHLLADPTSAQDAVTVNYGSLNYANVHLNNVSSTAIPTALLPDASALTGRNLGSSTKYWLNAYVTEIFLGTDNATWFTNSSGDIVSGQAANKKFRWTNSSTLADYMVLDPNTFTLYLSYPVTGISFEDISGNVGNIYKLGSSGGLNYNVGNNEYHVFQINNVNVLAINYDNTYGDTGYLDFLQGTYTNANAGTHGAVPAQVVGYVIVQVNNTHYKIPYFNI